MCKARALGVDRQKAGIPESLNKKSRSGEQLFT
jgi:hypothetical protein